jgi:hypothetical protein
LREISNRLPRLEEQVVLPLRELHRIAAVNQPRDFGQRFSRQQNFRVGFLAG